jgi:hypothetical protein
MLLVLLLSAASTRLLLLLLVAMSMLVERVRAVMTEMVPVLVASLELLLLRLFGMPALSVLLLLQPLVLSNVSGSLLTGREAGGV